MDEDLFPSSLTGFGLDLVLASLQLPSTSALGNQLGLSGLDSDTTTRLFSGFAEEGAIGKGEGEDYEDEVDLEIKREEQEDIWGSETDGGPHPLLPATTERSPLHDDEPLNDEDDIFGEPARKKRRKMKKTRIVEEKRPPDVLELFPDFEPGKILNFTELLKGHTLKKSRVKYRPYNGK